MNGMPRNVELQRHARPSRTGVAAIGLAALTLFVGCRDVDRFALEPGEAYCGSLVSTPVFQEGLLPENTPPSLRMRLSLDVDNLTTVPGTITTDDSQRGLCSGEDKALFENAPLRTIQEVLHDPISQAVIGEGREQSFFTYVSSSCGHQMMAVVSLMRSGGVEVRLFKPAPAPESDTPSGALPGFGLFTLERKSETSCDF